ncbi:pentapeptide repeat-containing protein [Celeribacter sp.]|uniref:pentapeptide repeat-containing protein n=1 Tax=Celeribacter sp. TaxID=1890673 RepID=UPI003A93C1D3
MIQNLETLIHRVADTNMGWLAAFIFGCILIAKSVPASAPEGGLTKLKERLGAGAWPDILFWGVVLLWIALTGLLIFGLLTFILDIITHPTPQDDDGRTFYTLVTKTAALTAVLGAVVAFPFTVLRLKLTDTQTKTAEQNHFNDILSKAIANLGAEKVVKREDDVEKSVPALEVRNGGILALERLARENLSFHIEVMEILTAYIRHNIQAYVEYKSAQKKPIRPRDDIITALNVISRRSPAQRQTEKDADYILQLNDTTFAGMILSGYDFSGINFERTNFSKARLDGLDLSAANLEYCKFSNASLVRVWWQDAVFNDTQFGNVYLLRMRVPVERLQNVYGQTLKFAQMTNCQIALPNKTTWPLDAMHFRYCDFVKNSFTKYSDDYFSKCIFDNCDLSKTGIRQAQLDAALGTRKCKIPDDLSFPEQWPDYDAPTKEWEKRVEDEIPF